MISARRKRIRNDRLIAVALTEVNKPTVRNLKDLEPEHLHGIEQFFVACNRAQGRDFRVTGRRGPREAHAALKHAEQRPELRIVRPPVRRDGLTRPFRQRLSRRGVASGSNRE